MPEIKIPTGELLIALGEDILRSGKVIDLVPQILEVLTLLATGADVEDRDRLQADEIRHELLGLGFK